MNEKQPKMQATNDPETPLERMEKANREHREKLDKDNLELQANRFVRGVSETARLIEKEELKQQVDRLVAGVSEVAQQTIDADPLKKVVVAVATSGALERLVAFAEEHPELRASGDIQQRLANLFPSDAERPVGIEGEKLVDYLTGMFNNRWVREGKGTLVEYKEDVLADMSLEQIGPSFPLRYGPPAVLLRLEGTDAAFLAVDGYEKNGSEVYLKGDTNTEVYMYCGCGSHEQFDAEAVKALLEEAKKAGVSTIIGRYLNPRDFSTPVAEPLVLGFLDRLLRVKTGGRSVSWSSPVKIVDIGNLPSEYKKVLEDKHLKATRSKEQY